MNFNTPTVANGLRIKFDTIIGPYPPNMAS